MKLVKVYQTQDGKTFDSRSEAILHETKAQIENRLMEVLRISMKTGRPEAVIKEIIEEAAAVKIILQKIKIHKSKNVAVKVAA